MLETADLEEMFAEKRATLLDDPILVIDAGKIKDHFANTSTELTSRNITASHVYHVKAGPMEAIQYIPDSVQLIASIDELETVAGINSQRGEDAEYGLHIGTPSRERDREDGLVRTPTVSEFTEIISSIAPSDLSKFKKIIFDGTSPKGITFESYYLNILKALSKKVSLTGFTVEFKIEKSEIVAHDPRLLSWHDAARGISGLKNFRTYYKKIKEELGDEVKVGINLYAGNPNTKDKLEYCRGYIPALLGMNGAEGTNVYPETFTLGGFDNMIDSEILGALKTIQERLSKIIPDTLLVLEHGSNLQNSCSLLVFPGSMTRFNIAEYIPDIKSADIITKMKFMQSIEYIETNIGKVAVVRRPTSYIWKQSRAMTKKDRARSKITHYPIQTVTIHSSHMI